MQQTWGWLQWLQVMQSFPPSDFVCTPQPQKSLGSIFVRDVLSLAHENIIGMSEYSLSSCQWMIFVRKKSCNLQWKLTHIHVQPVLWREAEGLLGDVHSSQHHNSPHRTLLDRPFHQGNKSQIMTNHNTNHHNTTNHKSWQITTTPQYSSLASPSSPG